MRSNESLGKPSFHAMVLTCVAVTSVLSTAQAPPKFESFSATTTNLAVGNGEAVRINVSVWTPEADREKFVAAFREKGEAQLAEALGNAPSAGYVWTSESLGYSLRYAHKVPLPDGGERIVLATDRPLGSWGRTTWRAAAGQGDQEAQLTFIEIRLNLQGRGEGKMSLAAKITADGDGKALELENYVGAPVLLKEVRRTSQAP